MIENPRKLMGNQDIDMPMYFQSYPLLVIWSVLHIIAKVHSQLQQQKYEKLL